MPQDDHLRMSDPRRLCRSLIIKKALQSPEVDRRVCIYCLITVRRRSQSCAFHDSTQGDLLLVAPKNKKAENKLNDDHDNAKDRIKRHSGLPFVRLWALASAKAPKP